MASIRLPCLVPGCRRSLRADDPDDEEGICQRHWSSLPARERRRYKARRREFFAARDAALDGAEISRLLVVTARLWSWLRRRAIEHELGL